jgi:hypothetical protein
MHGMLVLFFAACALMVSDAGAADAPVMANYEKYVASIRSATFHSRFDDRLAEQKTFTNTLHQDWKIDFVGKRRWVVTNKPPYGSPRDPQNPMAHLYSETLIGPGKELEIEVDPANNQGEVCTAYLTVPANYWENCHGGFGYLAYPFGYLETGKGYLNIASLLRSKQVKSASTEKSGKFVVQKCATPVYEVTLKLSPEKGWMPEQIECKRIAKQAEAQQLIYSKYTVDKSSQHEGIWLPDAFSCEAKVSGGTVQLRDEERVEIVDGEEVYHAVEDKNAPGGRTVERKACEVVAKVSLSDVKLNAVTDDDFRLQAKTPDGLRVSMQDARDDSYEWRDGKIMKVAKTELPKR